MSTSPKQVLKNKNFALPNYTEHTKNINKKIIMQSQANNNILTKNQMKNPNFYI